jgi:hypothetical protein
MFIVNTWSRPGRLRTRSRQWLQIRVLMEIDKEYSVRSTSTDAAPLIFPDRYGKHSLRVRDREFADSDGPFSTMRCFHFEYFRFPNSHFKHTHTITSRLSTVLTLLRGEHSTVDCGNVEIRMSNACIRLMRETFRYLQTPSLADIALHSASHGCRTQAAGSRMCNRAPPHRGQIVLDLHTTNVRWSSSQVWIPSNIQPSTAPFTGRDTAC